jgi:hypothetical protein
MFILTEGGAEIELLVPMERETKFRAKWSKLQVFKNINEQLNKTEISSFSPYP